MLQAQLQTQARKRAVNKTRNTVTEFSASLRYGWNGNLNSFAPSERQFRRWNQIFAPLHAHVCRANVLE